MIGYYLLSFTYLMSFGCFIGEVFTYSACVRLPRIDLGAELAIIVALRDKLSSGEVLFGTGCYFKGGVSGESAVGVVGLALFTSESRVL